MVDMFDQEQYSWSNSCAFDRILEATSGSCFAQRAHPLHQELQDAAALLARDIRSLYKSLLGNLFQDEGLPTCRSAYMKRQDAEGIIG